MIKEWLKSIAITFGYPVVWLLWLLPCGIIAPFASIRLKKCYWWLYFLPLFVYRIYAYLRYKKGKSVHKNND